MANPSRPNFKDVIDNQWGTLVANQVVRRYANAAERDADLAGFAPADLAGQVCLLTAVGYKMLYQVHNGASWINALQLPSTANPATNLGQMFAGMVSGNVGISSLGVVWPEPMDGSFSGPIVCATPTPAGTYFPIAPTCTCAVANVTILGCTITFRNNGAVIPDGNPAAAFVIAVAAPSPFITGPNTADILSDGEAAQQPEGLVLPDGVPLGVIGPRA
jgi:hypothetical protein